MIRASAVVSINGNIGNPLSESFGGWTSSEDKAYFNGLVDRSSLFVVGVNTWNGLPGAVKGFIKDRTDDQWILDRSDLSSQKVIDNMRTTLTAIGRVNSVLIGGGPVVWSKLFGIVDEWHIVHEPVITSTGPQLMAPHVDLRMRVIATELLNDFGTMVKVYCSRRRLRIH